MLIVLDWTTDVKTYLSLCAQGLPEEQRPDRCRHCSSERIPHRHGKFLRWLFTLDEAMQIPVFRFLCPDCRKSFCVLPGFVETYHQSAVEVKETVTERVAEGRSLTEIAEESKDFAGGHYAEKTLWRWLKRWQERLYTHEEQLWSNIIRGMDEPLPRERTSRWRALLKAWSTLRRSDSLFHALLHLERSSVLSSIGQNPTEAGHG